MFRVLGPLRLFICVARRVRGHSRQRFVGILRRLAVRAGLTLALLGAFSAPVAAQVSDSQNDGSDARYDALLATPNTYTPSPDTNLIATAPGLEQQVPRSQFRANALVPVTYNSNPFALPCCGPSSLEVSPLAGLSWATPVGDLPLRFTANIRTEFDRFPDQSAADFDKLRATARLQYVDPDNDQAYVPFFSFVPRVDFTPTFADQFATRYDLNFGFNKTFNFDGDFNRVPFSGSSSGDAAWSFGLTSMIQKRFRDPAAGSWAFEVVPSVSYVISSQWNFSSAMVLEHRAFDAIGTFGQRDYFIEPIATVEFVTPESWFGSSAAIVGRPAIDFQVAYEQNWSNLSAANFAIWHAGIALKFGWNL